MIRSIVELEKILLDEINSFEKDEINSHQGKYYNEITGNMSTVLTYMLSKLNLVREDWDDCWLDDSLITKIVKLKERLRIWGILITGRENTNQQWTNPIYFEIRNTDEYKNFTEYTFLLGDKNSEELTYTDFIENRFI